MIPRLSPFLHSTRVRLMAATLAILAALASSAAAQVSPPGGAPPRDPAASGTAAPGSRALTDTAGPSTRANSATWSVQGPPGGRWTLRSGRDYEVIVTAGDQPLQNLMLVGSTLQNTETGARIGVRAIKLCVVEGASGERRDTTGACTAVAKIDSTKSAPVVLRIHPDTSVEAGVYTGDLSFAAEGGEGVKPLALRVENTSTGRWILGGLAIAAGVLLSWLLTVFLRQRAARAAAELPAAQLRDAVRELRPQATAATELTGVELPGLLTQLADREEALSIAALEANGLPPKIANPFSAQQDGTEAYQRYLTDQGGRIRALVVIVRVGVGTAVAMWPAGNHARITQALRELDALAAQQPTPEQAEVRVREILAGIPDPAAAVRDFDHGRAAGSAAELPPAREVMVQLQRISLTGWSISLVLTVLVGLVVLVITNHGFGTLLDYVKCVFWGMGLPFVTQQIQQLSPTSVYSTLKLTLPK